MNHLVSFLKSILPHSHLPVGIASFMKSCEMELAVSRFQTLSNSRAYSQIWLFTNRLPSSSLVVICEH